MTFFASLKRATLSSVKRRRPWRRIFAARSLGTQLLGPNNCCGWNMPTTPCPAHPPACPPSSVPMATNPCCSLCVSLGQTLLAHLDKGPTGSPEEQREVQADCRCFEAPHYQVGQKMWFHYALKAINTCNHCGKSFIKRNSLKIHQQTQTTEKPYTCEQCDKSFRHSGTLEDHQWTHTGENPYICEQCRKSFRQSGTLKKHQQTHAGEKPYTCEQCKSLTQSGTLKNHQNLYTGDQTHICEQCGTIWIF